MKELADVLTEISGRLDVPQPARSRVILEIAADIRAMEAQFVADGVEPQEARRAALERCDLSDGAIADLVRVHATPYRRFLDRLSVPARTRWERGLLGLTSAVTLLIAGRMVVDVALLRSGGVVAWLAALVAVPAVVFGVAKGYTAFLAQHHDAARLRRWLIVLPALAAYNLLLAAVGAWGGFYRVAWRVAEDPNAIVVLLTGWLRTTSAASVVCLLSAVLIAALWFTLEAKASRIEEAEATALLHG